MSTFTLTGYSCPTCIDLAVFGFISKEESSLKKNLEYTPAYGGNTQYPCFYLSESYYNIHGDNSSPDLDSNRWGSIVLSVDQVGCPVITSKYNGIYKISYTSAKNTKEVTLIIKMQ